MKKRLPPFVAGMLTMALAGSVGVSALAASGAMTITVDPINIQVNGQTFQPKDAKGNDVPVFALGGTTYAPLRALAEAYGLEVGYDQEANMATVADPTASPAPDSTTLPADYSDWSAEEKAAYQEFKGMWEAKNTEYVSDGYGTSKFYIYIGTFTENELTGYLASLGRDNVLLYTRAIVEEELSKQTVKDVNLLFFYDENGYNSDTVLWYANYHQGVNKPYEFSAIEWNID